MNPNQTLKKRDLYLNKLIKFKDMEAVKIITGIRRCGKSSLLKLMVEYLKTHGVEDEQIIEINFESYDFRTMGKDEFYHYVKEKSLHGKRLYLFFDEVQRVEGWEDVVNAFRVDLNCDIYLTGSNAYLLSSEYSTYLAGRFVEIKMLPLSFWEFLYFHDFTIRETINVLGENEKYICDKNDRRYELKELFNAYLRFGGMPIIADIGFDQEKAYTLLEGMYSTIVIRDIMERGKRLGESTLSDTALLSKIVRFLADNIGSNISVNSIGNVLVNEGLLKDTKRKGAPSAHTVQAYINALLESYIFYDIKRFDIKGKAFLRTLGKYYIVDIGLRNYLLGFRNRDIGHILENVVYFELIRRGYDVSVGKVDNLEIDFIAINSNEKIYIQVTESMLGEEVKKRELLPLEKIRDNYEKVVLSLDEGIGVNNSYEGIKVLNLLTWLLEDKYYTNFKGL